MPRSNSGRQSRRIEGKYGKYLASAGIASPPQLLSNLHSRALTSGAAVIYNDIRPSAHHGRERIALGLDHPNLLDSPYFRRRVLDMDRVQILGLTDHLPCQPTRLFYQNR